MEGLNKYVILAHPQVTYRDHIVRIEWDLAATAEVEAEVNRIREERERQMGFPTGGAWLKHQSVG